MAGRSRLTVALVALALVATLGVFARPPVASAGTTPFSDIAGTTFEADIEWLFTEGITKGCTATLYCPDRSVTRGEMASFLVRMFKLTEGGDIDAFTDDDGTTHEVEINKLAASGITVGCTATTFCPKANVRRDEMASFLARAIPLTTGAGRNYFRDDDGTTHEINIDRLAAAGIASGCYPYTYCPSQSVTRGQMAAFLHRTVKPVTPPPFPAPSGPQTLYVETGGSDDANACFVAAKPCRTIRHALRIAVDGDTIAIGPGTFAEGNLFVGHDLTIAGDPGGGTTIDASGGDAQRIFDVYEVAVTLSDLTLTGGRAEWAGAIQYGGIRPVTSLTIIDSTVTGNRTVRGATIAPRVWGNSLTIVGSAIHGNLGYAVRANGLLTIVGTTIGGNTAGIKFDGTELLLANSTVSGNVSAGEGGGVLAYGPVHITVVNSTVTGNVAQEGGGGIALAGNFAGVYGDMDLVNSIIAGNIAPIGPDVSGSIASKLASIVGIPAGLVLADILVPGGLQDNGGPTRTIALTDAATNPALDHGDAATCAAAPVDGLDQRGLPRTPPCDIGAYELQP